MKVAMLLVSVLFLATAVEALPGGGGRQLAKDKKPNKKCKVDACWKKCQKLKPEPQSFTPGGMLKSLVVGEPLPPQCDIAYMETCLEGSSACKALCKEVFDQCKKTEKACKKNLKMCKKECAKPEPPFDCSFAWGGKKKCCETQCKTADLECIETCIAA